MSASIDWKLDDHRADKIVAMVEMTLNDLYAMVKVIHFGVNFFSYMTSYRLSIVTFALGRTLSHNSGDSMPSAHSLDVSVLWECLSLLTYLLGLTFITQKLICCKFDCLVCFVFRNLQFQCLLLNVSLL